MRILITLAAISVLGCSASKAALVGLTAAVATETVASAVQAAEERQREEERERARQQSCKCCATKEYNPSTRTWRCTGCDDT
jgi:hypothetical protein